MVTRVLPQKTGRQQEYQVTKLIDGKPTHEYMTLVEDALYRIISLRDPRPLGPDVDLSGEDLARTDRRTLRTP